MNNPRVETPAPAERAALSTKVSQFTESVIREMTRLAIAHGRIDAAVFGFACRIR